MTSNQPIRSFTRVAIAVVIAAVVLSAAAMSYASFEATITKTVPEVSTTTVTTTLPSTSSITTLSTCIVPGLINNGPVFLRVVSDSNETPIAGAQVTATSQSLTFACNGSVVATSPTRLTFTTNSSEWYPLGGENNGSYSIAVEYSGQTYSLTANLKPVSAVCASLYIPSGRTNITSITGQPTCQSISSSSLTGSTNTVKTTE